MSRMRPSAFGLHFSDDGIPLSSYAWLMIAHHEAGHAVVGTLLGFILRHLHLRAEKRTPGAHWTGHRRNSPLRPMVVLAGSIATKRYDFVLSKNSSRGTNADRNEFFRLVPDEKELRPYAVATECLVIANWLAIEAVAFELFEKNELSGQEVRNIMRTVLEVD
jgi:hypothetical protein